MGFSYRIILCGPHDSVVLDFELIIKYVRKCEDYNHLHIGHIGKFEFKKCIFFGVEGRIMYK